MFWIFYGDNVMLIELCVLIFLFEEMCMNFNDEMNAASHAMVSVLMILVIG